MFISDYLTITPSMNPYSEQHTKRCCIMLYVMAKHKDNWSSKVPLGQYPKFVLPCTYYIWVIYRYSLKYPHFPCEKCLPSVTRLWHFARNGHGHMRQWPLRRFARYGKSAPRRILVFRVMGLVNPCMNEWSLHNPLIRPYFLGGKWHWRGSALDSHGLDISENNPLTQPFWIMKRTFRLCFSYSISNPQKFQG